MAWAKEEYMRYMEDADKIEDILDELQYELLLIDEEELRRERNWQ